MLCFFVWQLVVYYVERLDWLIAVAAMGLGHLGVQSKLSTVFFRGGPLSPGFTKAAFSCIR